MPPALSQGGGRGSVKYKKSMSPFFGHCPPCPQISVASLLSAMHNKYLWKQRTRNFGVKIVFQRILLIDIPWTYILLDCKEQLKIVG